MFKIERFKGMAPRYAPEILPDNAAQLAENCRFDSGVLNGYQGEASGAAYGTVTAAAKSMFPENITANPITWLSYTSDTDIVRSPLAADQYDRLYFSNGSQPKMKVTGNSTLFDLGIPIPDVTTMTATIDSTNREAGQPIAVDAETRYYVVTYVSAFDEEGPPSEAVGLTSGPWYPGDVVDLANLPTGPISGTTNIDRIRVYRTNTGTSSTEYQLVATYTTTQAGSTQTDSVENAELGVILPSVEWEGPPVGIKGFVVHPAGFLAGFKGRTVYLSEKYLPHAWPYSYAVESNVVGLGIYGNTLLVMTEAQPHIMSGTEPDGLFPEKIEIDYPCIQKRGIVDMGEVVIYPSTEGLVGVGLGDTPKLLTETIITREEWISATQDPTGMLASQYDGKYIARITVSGAYKGILYDPNNNDYVELSSFNPEALYFHRKTGDLYLKNFSSTAVTKFDESGTKAAVTWKSKKFRLDKPRNMGVAQVYADSYPVTLKVYADEVLKHTETVASNDVFKLPSGFLATHWEVQVESGGAAVSAIHVAETARQLSEEA